MAAGQSATEQLLAALPKCAAACAQSILPSSTCSLTDVACLCADAPILGQIEQCSTANCTVIEALSAFNATQTACGVTPTDLSQTYIIVTSIFLALAVLFYLIRLYVRPPLTPGFRIDDGIMLVATLTVVVFTALNLQAANKGLGKDIWNVEPDNIDIVLKDFFIGEFLYIFISVVTKLAVLAFYLKVFSQPYFQKAAYLVMGLCLSYFVSYMFVLGFECTPVSFFWEQWRDPSAGTCININAGGWAAAAINIALDVAILALPVPVILRLQISRQQKLQVLSMFGVGSLITVVSIIRLQSLIKFAKDSNRCWPSRFGTTKDHAGSYLRQSSTSHGGGGPRQGPPQPPPPQYQPQQPLSANPNDRIYMSKSASYDVNVSQVPGRRDDVELSESDGWLATSKGGRGYMSSSNNHERY
ncbi:hypothetical protein H2204_010893 [Knufia peltigerae]|uniref:CFEM domain-containing protein n=1 Tax=Knufia peltigerae TaxID=1002370 RepID=A0AA38XVP7_9EURO|nr:hypothetical protein H2204_010893 [Knufia peltigerae]